MVASLRTESSMGVLLILATLLSQSRCQASPGGARIAQLIANPLLSGLLGKRCGNLSRKLRDILPRNCPIAGASRSPRLHSATDRRVIEA